jgi:hypothetical protein
MVHHSEIRNLSSRGSVQVPDKSIPLYAVMQDVPRIRTRGKVRQSYFERSRFCNSRDTLSHSLLRKVRLWLKAVSSESCGPDRHTHSKCVPVVE